MTPESDPQISLPLEEYTEYLKLTSMMSFYAPIRTVSETNTRQCWKAKARRAKAQRTAARLMTKTARGNSQSPKPTERYHVMITRLAPRLLDTGNLGAALKAVQDGIADGLGVDDGPKAGHVWEYDQRTTRKAYNPDRYAVEVAIWQEPREADR